MKKITFLLTLLTMSLSFGQNLLTGGDLEGLTTGKITPGSSPWDTSVASAAAQSSINNNNAVAHAGDQFINLPNDFTNFRQPFTAVATTTYTVSFWYQFAMPQGTPESTDGIYVSIRQNTGGNGTQFGTPIQIYVDPSTVDGNWHEATFDFTAPQTDLLFFLTKQTRAAGGPNNAARMDDFSIVVTPTASLEDLQKFGFNASPNPATDYINLSASKNIDKIEIYNVVGQLVESRVLNSNNNRINVSNLSKGIYIMKAFIEDAVGSYKFVKQ